MTDLLSIAAAIPALGAAWIAFRTIAGPAAGLGSEVVGNGRGVARERFHQIAWIAAMATLAVVGVALIVSLASSPSTAAGSEKRELESSTPAAAVPAEKSLTPAGNSVPFDGLSVSFMALTAAVWLPVISIARQCDADRPGLLYGLLLLLETAYLGVFRVDNVLFFCVFLESSTLLLYLLISGWGGEGADRIARKLLVFNLAGGTLVILGILGLVLTKARISQTAAGIPDGFPFSVRDLVERITRLAVEDVEAQEYWNDARGWILTSLVLGLAIMTPVVPFHNWFAAAVAEGPLCTGLALLGAGARLSTYAFLRFVTPLGGNFGGTGSIITALIALGALHTSLLALGHGDMRKMAACASLSQTAVAIAAMFSVDSSGAIGAALLSLSGGLAFVLLLFAFGSLEQRHGVRELSLIGGIAGKLPQTSAVLLLAVLSLTGVPGLCGFPGWFASLGAIFEFSWWSAFLAMIAGLIVGWALFWMLQRLVFGSPRILQTPGFSAMEESSSEGAGARDLPGVELLAIAPLLAGLIYFGIRPQALTELLRVSVFHDFVPH